MGWQDSQKDRQYYFYYSIHDNSDNVGIEESPSPSLRGFRHHNRYLETFTGSWSNTAWSSQNMNTVTNDDLVGAPTAVNDVGANSTILSSSSHDATVSMAAAPLVIRAFLLICFLLACLYTHRQGNQRSGETIAVSDGDTVATSNSYTCDKELKNDNDDDNSITDDSGMDSDVDEMDDKASEMGHGNASS